MNLAPLVSVIIPTFNRAQVLNRAIISVLNQTYKNFELIIVNDGSTDETDAVLVKLNNEKIIIMEQDNKGVSNARNNGIKKAQGEYICFLDSDDEWLDTKLEEQINYLKQNPKTVCIHTNEVWIRNGVRVNQMKKHKKGGGDQYLPSLQLCLISPSTVFLKKQVLIELGCFREDFPVCEDYDLWLKLTSIYPIDYIDKPLIKKYGGHEDQLSKKFFGMDYYRILAIDWILKNRELNEAKRMQSIDILIKKTDILLNGKIKHGNYENFDAVMQIKNRWES